MLWVPSMGWGHIHSSVMGSPNTHGDFFFRRGGWICTPWRWCVTARVDGWVELVRRFTRGEAGVGTGVPRILGRLDRPGDL